MPVPDFRGRSADQIAGGAYVNDSAWHVHACLSWCDYAERVNAPTALHYAGFHLRMAVEHLWFEVLFAASGGSLSTAEYDEALRSTTKLYKAIDAAEPSYVRFAEFVQMMASIDSQQHPHTIIWDMTRLKRIHGGCSESLLHFQGVVEKGYRNAAWVESRIRFLHDSAMWMWGNMITRGALVVYSPEGLKKPEVFSLWEKYKDGASSIEDTRTGLKIVQPIVKDRPVP